MNFRIVQIAVLFLCSFAGMSAQTRSGVNAGLERELVNYERMCAECAELRAKVRAGDIVSKDVAEKTIDLFVSKNRELKARESEMTASQRARFTAVGKWFSSGEMPVILSYGDIPELEIAGCLRPSFPEDVICSADTLRSRPFFRENPSDAVLMKAAGLRTWLLLSGAYPLPAGGLTFLMQKGRWGGYVSFRSDFLFSRPSYHCDSDGMLPDGTKLWPGGQTRICTLSATAGPVAGIKKWLSLYAGAGYGYSHYMWTDIDGNWVQVDDMSYSGVAVEAGCLFTFGRFCFSAGVETLSFHTVSAVIGAGIRF
ncbi:MAG: hypothetical protein ACI3ZS_04645 [Candidatus Cryptobacteroides sp.]